ncbi:hypothetical protein LguiA_019204 [Lonicera macranthoides]
MKLLDHGYSVHTTLRFDPAENKKDISYLTSLPGASKNLKIFNADLTQPDSFNAAIGGCTGVFHLAHPCNPNGTLSTETVTNIAIEGTLGILKACLDSKTVKRVVYISSSATVIPSDKEKSSADETIWTDVSSLVSLNTRGTSYVVAKTKTEMVAWEFAEKHGLDLVSVIPPIVFGPFICPWFPNTVQMGLALILGLCTSYICLVHLICNVTKCSFGSKFCAFLEFELVNSQTDLSFNAGKQEYYGVLAKSNMVHVDDLASAHIFLLECPEAKGRYICSSHEITIHKLAEFLSAKYPQFQIPNSE